MNHLLIIRLISERLSGHVDCSSMHGEVPGFSLKNIVCFSKSFPTIFKNSHLKTLVTSTTDSWREFKIVKNEYRFQHKASTSCSEGLNIQQIKPSPTLHLHTFFHYSVSPLSVKLQCRQISSPSCAEPSSALPASACLHLQI